MGFVSRITTYIAGSVPRIKAFDLNAIQDAISEIITGFITLKSAHLDGTGNNASTAPAGALRVSSSKSGGAFPCPTVVWGDFHKESATFAGGSLMGDGTWIGGVNIKTASRLALGKYEITCNGLTGDLLRTRFWVTPSGSDANPRFGQIHNLSIGTGDLVFEVYIFNGTTGALDDSKFFFGVDGG